eukprot:1192518-Prorocentrum_minimum.AAC.2
MIAPRLVRGSREAVDGDANGARLGLGPGGSGGGGAACVSPRASSTELLLWLWLRILWLACPLLALTPAATLELVGALLPGGGVSHSETRVRPELLDIGPGTSPRALAPCKPSRYAPPCKLMRSRSGLSSPASRSSSSREDELVPR